MKIIFLGCPGSGKSTQAKKLSEHLSLPYIEMGQVFRNRATDKDEVGIKIKKALDAGVLVENEIVIKILHNLLNQDTYKSGYILDGYPRDDHQLKGLDSDIDMVFYINISDEEAIKRLLLRARENETKEILAKRLEVYHNLTEPLLDYFRQKGILKEINGEKSIEEVNSEVLKAYQEDAKK